jgi:hypothetical protein
VSNDFSTELGKNLTQLYGQQLKANGQAHFASIPLDEGVLLRVRTSEGLSQMIVHTRRIGVRKGHALVLVKGQLVKPDGEFIQFRNLLAVPKDASLEQIEITEEALIEARGIVITPEGKKLEFHDRNDEFFKAVEADQTSRSNCAGCPKRVDFRAMQIERRVGENRCWLCTGVALAVGASASALLAWTTQPLLGLLGIRTLQMLILIAGLLFTGWRAWYWGYLPFQDWAAHALRLDR